jgi:hypothetical protein
MEEHVFTADEGERMLIKHPLMHGMSKNDLIMQALAYFKAGSRPRSLRADWMSHGG